MFASLTLENFKCFANETIDFKGLTVFTGANAAGKSSVIQALLLYSKAMQMEKTNILDVNETLNIQVGSPRNLVSQNAEGDSAYDFLIGIDQKQVRFWIDKESGLDLHAEVEGEKSAMDFTYLNAERVGPRMYYDAGGTEQFKPNGSNAVYLIERADNVGIELPEQMLLPNTSKKFSHQVEAWMSAILGEVQLAVRVDNAKAQTELRIKNSLSQESVLPTQTGFGITYVLPIVAAGLWATTKENTVFVVENPEAHLHPSAQSAIGKFLALLVDCGVQVIVETHSEHVVDGARVQMTYMQKTDEMLVNYMSQEDERVKILNLQIDVNGELTDWPEGFFDQKQIDLRELFKMRKMHGNKQ